MGVGLLGIVLFAKSACAVCVHLALLQVCMQLEMSRIGSGDKPSPQQGQVRLQGMLRSCCLCSTSVSIKRRHVMHYTLPLLANGMQ